MPTINLSDFMSSSYLGFTGSQGDQGFTGSQGDQGFTGSQGERGEVLRLTVSETTSAIADEETIALTLTGFKSYFLYQIQTSVAAWVRVYANESARTGDINRTINTDPDISQGIIAEVITTSSDPVLISPGVVGFNNEDPPTTDVPILVTNKSGSTQSIEINLTLVSIEYD
jgi:hypothetical protein